MVLSYYVYRYLLLTGNLLYTRILHGFQDRRQPDICSINGEAVLKILTQYPPHPLSTALLRKAGTTVHVHSEYAPLPPNQADGIPEI